MSIILFKRSDNVDDAKEKWAGKKPPWWKRSISVKSQVCFFKRKQKKLNGRGQKEMFPRLFPFMLGPFSASVSLSC